MRSHSANGGPGTSPRRTDFSRLRTLSGFNNIVGAVVVTQRRSRRATCRNGGGDVGLSAFTQAHGINCTEASGRDGRPFGIDPSFSKFSSLYSGKHAATEYYNGKLVSGAGASPQQAFPDPLEGYFGPDGFIPYGFFPHEWDTVARRLKNDSHVLPSARGEFKLFFDVRADASEAGRLLTFLQDGRFLDDSTDALDVEMVTYNAEEALFTSLRFAFQVERTGGLSWDYSIRTVDAAADRGALLVLLEVVAIICLCVSILVEVFDMVRAFLELKVVAYAMSPFNWLDLSGFVIQCLAWAKWFEIRARVSGLRLEGRGNYPVLADPFGRIRPFRTDAKEELALLRLLEDVSGLADLHVQYSSLTGFVVVVLTFKVIKSLDFQPRMGLITRTLARAGSNLAHFTGLFLFIFLGYAFVGHIMFGPNLPAMATLGGSLRALGYILLNFDPTQFHAQMRHAVQREGDGGGGIEYEVYIWTFVFVCVFILLNILLAILVAGYTDMADSSYAAGSIAEDLADYFAYAARRALLPVTSFISDEQLAVHLREELTALRTIRGDTGGGGLESKTRASADALDSREVILLGRGRSITDRGVRALVKSLLARHANRGGGGPPAAVAAAVRWAEKRRMSLGAVAPPEEEDVGNEQAPRTNHLVADLLQRYGDSVAGRAGEIARDSRGLLELEGQGRLLRVEAGVDRLDARTGRLEALLQQALAAVKALAPAPAPAAANAALPPTNSDSPISPPEHPCGSHWRPPMALFASPGGGGGGGGGEDGDDCAPSPGPLHGGPEIKRGQSEMGPAEAACLQPSIDSDPLAAPGPPGLETVAPSESLARASTSTNRFEPAPAGPSRPAREGGERLGDVWPEPAEGDGCGPVRPYHPSPTGKRLGSAVGAAADGAGDSEDGGAAAASTLQVMVVAARGLPRMDVMRSCDPYCLVFVQEADGRAGPPQVTRTLAGRRPAWEERFAFDVVAAAGQRLVVAVWDRDGVSADDLIGSAGLELRDLAVGVVTDDWFPLRGPALQGSADGTAVRIRALLRPADQPESRPAEQKGRAEV